MESININPTEVKLFKTIQCVGGSTSAKLFFFFNTYHGDTKTLCTLLTLTLSQVYSGVFLILLFFLYLFALITEEDFLISPCYSLELCIQMNISFLSPLPFTSLLFSAICKASSDNHFAFLHFFFLGMVLITTSLIRGSMIFGAKNNAL